MNLVADEQESEDVAFVVGPESGVGAGDGIFETIDAIT
jgi:hypothetical protein